MFTIILKVVYIENKGVQQDSNLWVVALDLGGRHSFSFWTCSFHVKIVILFSLSMDEIIGDLFYNRECAPNRYISLIMGIS